MVRVKNLDIFKNTDIMVEKCEQITLDSTWRGENVCDVYSRLYYIKSGNGFLMYNNKKILLEAEHVYLVPSGCTFSYGCKVLEKIFFHIYIPTLENYDLLSNVKDICVLPFSKEKYAELSDNCFSDDYVSILNVKRILLNTLLLMLEQYDFQNIPIKNYSPLMQEILSYVNQNAKISLTAKEISEKFFISESSLTKSFKKEIGFTLGRYIEKTVFIKACRLLSDEGISIKEISESLNFCDQFYFSRWFKRIGRSTPSNYRRSIRT